jgi:hypothetical protein
LLFEKIQIATIENVKKNIFSLVIKRFICNFSQLVMVVSTVAPNVQGFVQVGNFEFRLLEASAKFIDLS